MLAHLAKNETEADALLDQALQSGAALEKFGEIIQAQGGDPEVLKDRTKLPQAQHQTDLSLGQAGTIHGVDAYALALGAMKLGAGRKTADDNIDPSVGLEVLKARGDTVAADEAALRVHHNGPIDAIEDELKTAFTIGEGEVETYPLVIDRI